MSWDPSDLSKELNFGVILALQACTPVSSLLDGPDGCGHACFVVWIWFRLTRRYLAYRPGKHHQHQPTPKELNFGGSFWFYRTALLYLWEWPFRMWLTTLAISCPEGGRVGLSPLSGQRTVQVCKVKGACHGGYGCTREGPAFFSMSNPPRFLVWLKGSRKVVGLILMIS